MPFVSTRVTMLTLSLCAKNCICEERRMCQKMVTHTHRHSLPFDSQQSCSLYRWLTTSPTT